MLMGLLERLSFSRAQRVAVWTLCADLLESDYEIENALPLVAKVNEGAGNASIARTVEKFRAALEKNELRSAVARVAPPEEAMVFEGFGRADSAAIFRSAARIAEVRDRLSVAMRTNLIGPALLFVLAAGLVYAAGWGFVPALEKMAPREEWSPASQVVATIAVGFSDNVVWIGGGFVAFVVLLVWLGRTWVGPGRHIADRVVPFSLIRFVSGLSFIFSVVEAMRAGLDLNERLFADLASGGTRYTRHRILSIGRQMQRGETLGKAMQSTGHGFPAPELIPVVSALDGMPEWEERLGKFVDRWIVRSERMVAERAMVLNRVMTTVIALVIVSGIVAVGGLLEELVARGM